MRTRTTRWKYLALGLSGAAPFAYAVWFISAQDEFGPDSGPAVYAIHGAAWLGTLAIVLWAISDAASNPRVGGWRKLAWMGIFWVLPIATVPYVLLCRRPELGASVDRRCI